MTERKETAFRKAAQKDGMLFHLKQQEETSKSGNHQMCCNHNRN